MKNWNTETRKLSELLPYEHNPRKITDSAFKQLKKNIKKQGFRNPINITQDNIVLAGHQRLAAMLELYGAGFVVPVMVAPEKLTDEQIKEIIAADNLSFGEFDFDNLLRDFDFDNLVEIGFDVDDLRIEPIKDRKVEAREKKKTDATCASFDVVLDYQDKLRLIRVLNEIKKSYGITETDKAFMVLVDFYESTQESL